ncbi:MAG: CRTAC1 family protein [Halofilum sp. (in: g-proteobacteria)]|nr:CRTAC1 family protein [Halofilum sp. (in: g-proteobacteria)]
MTSGNDHSPREGAAGEQRIARAFRRSLATLALVAVVAGAGWGVHVLLDRLERDPGAEGARVTGPSDPGAGSGPEPPPAVYVDVTQAAGIDFVHENGAYGAKLLPETMGGGVAFFDYNRDGAPDLFLVNSAHWPGHRPDGEPPATHALYRNDGDGTFTNVTRGSGLDVSFYGMGVAVGDHDGDGWPDLYVTGVDDNRLFRNVDGTGRFDDVTEAAGVAGEPGQWSTAATFLDFDRDGDLDLFVGNYVQWTPEIDFEVDFRMTGVGRAYGPPNAYAGTYPVLYRNDGNGEFTDVSEGSGVRVDNPATGAPVAKTLAVAPADVDGDGWTDLLVANDTVQNFLLHNQGDGTFTEMGMRAGIGFDSNGAATGAMGIDTAHYSNDDRLGVVIGNFANEMSSLYLSVPGRPLQFNDEAVVEGIGAPTRGVLSFGAFFFDYDLDGRLDLFQTNGHIEEDINKVQPSQHYAQPSQLFWNCGEDCARTFREVDAGRIGDMGRPVVGRGAAPADIDDDGDLDVIITQPGRRPLLLRNDRARVNHWLRVRLEGPGRNRPGIGAQIELRAGSLQQRRSVTRTMSYLSQRPATATFGLGDHDRVDEIRVRWPDGSESTRTGVQVDRQVTIRQGD